MILKKSKYSVIILYNHGSQFLNKSNNHLENCQLKLLVLHETRWFFEVFELPGTGSSLILMFLQIPRPSNSLILLFHLPGTDGYHRNQRPAPHWSLQHTNTTRSHAWLTNPMYPGYIAWLGHLLKHDPQNLKLCAFGYDFFQMKTHNPGLFVWCSHMVIAIHSSEVCLIFPWLRMKTKLPNLEFLQFNKVQLISLDDLNFSVQMFLWSMFSSVDFAWKDWVNLANSTSAQVISSGALHEIYFLSTSTIWVPQQEVLLTWTWEFHMSIVMLDWELDPIFNWTQKCTCSETLGRRSKNGCSIFFCTNLSFRERISLLLFSANWLFPNFWGWKET